MTNTKYLTRILLFAALLVLTLGLLTGCSKTPGAKGDTGPIGPKGEKGDQGLQGEKGEKGDTGAKGSKGDKGDTGPSGSSPTVESWHIVGTSGEPSFTNGAKNAAFGNKVGFYKDPFGVVHLQGRFTCGANGAAMFTLPSGYRPSELLDFIIPQLGVDSNRLTIESNGEVGCFLGNNGQQSLEGVTFRAG